MEVTVLESTDSAEKVICKAARGDYMEGWNGDTSFEEIMSVVSHDDEHVERARENNHYPEETVETEAKMIAFIEKQLARGHYGPAEHPQITFSVNGVSRVTMAQITRHRHLTFDIQSMRYANFEEKEFVTPPSFTDPEHSTRKKGLIWYDTDSETPIEEQEPDTESMEEAKQLYEKALENSMKAYEQLNEMGIPVEDSRYALPLATPVNMTLSGNARTFLHLLDMRRKANAQHEIRELSEMLLDELFDWCPYTFKYYDENGPNKLSP